MTGTIFMNYRRGDDPGTTGRLYDRLEAEFSAGQLFMDVEGHIKGGDDFVEVLKAQVAQCDVFLAIIGPRWLSIVDEQGRRRLDNPEDWVRVEIAGALATAKRVIPVLVGGADIPRAEDLPEDVKPLARRQVIRITLERFKTDVQGLVSQIRAALADVETRRNAESAEFIKAKTDPPEFRDHLARFAGGTTERFATERLSGLVWATLDQADKAAVGDFIAEFPRSPHAAEAQAALSEVEAKEREERESTKRRAQETAAWAVVAGSTDKAAIDAFLKAWPDGAHAGDAKARLAELRSKGRFSRRAILKGVGYGVGGTVAAGGTALVTLMPGMPIWRLLHDQSIRTFTGHKDWVKSVAFAPDGRTALSGSVDDTVKLWDVATGRELRTFTGHARDVTAVAFAPDGRTALSGSWDTNMKLWDLATGVDLRTFTTGRHDVESVAFASDGRTALSGSRDRTLKLWDLATGNTLRTFKGHTFPVVSVAFAPDGRTALSGSWDKTLKLWDVATGNELRTFTGHTGHIKSVAFAPDGRTALSGGKGETITGDTVKLWDVATGKELRTFTGYWGGVNAVAFAPDGRTAISGSNDETLRLWDVATSKQLRTFTGHAGGVLSIAISPDGRTALSGSDDNTLKLWDLTPYLPAAK